MNNNLGGLGCCSGGEPPEARKNAIIKGAPVIRYANVAIAPDNTRLDVVLSNTSEYIQNTPRWNGKSTRYRTATGAYEKEQDTEERTTGYSFAIFNLLSNHACSFQLELKISCCLTDDCEKFRCQNGTDGSGICYHSQTPRFNTSSQSTDGDYYKCDDMHRSPIEVLKVPSLELALGIYDIDKDSNSARPAIEVVEVFGYNHSGFVQPSSKAEGKVTKETAYFDMVETGNADGTVTGIFTARENGEGDDNPTNPREVTLEQASRAINLYFFTEGTVDFTYKVTPLQAENPNNYPDPGDNFPIAAGSVATGRNMLFSGTGKTDLEYCLPPPSPPPPARPAPPPPPTTYTTSALTASVVTATIALTQLPSSSACGVAQAATAATF